MIKIVVTAPRGAMDSLMVQEGYRHPEIEVIGCVGAPGRDYIGKDAGLVCGLGFEIGAPVYDSLEAVTEDGRQLIDTCDMVVDFSTIELSMEVLDCCLKHNRALLCGTTGFRQENLDAFAAASKKIPLIQTANTSCVVTIMKKLLREAAALLEDRAGIEIVEMHADTKLDAPSGTSIELAKEMASVMKHKTYDDIKFHAVRAGNTPGSNHVIFGCQGEMLQINHDEYDWRSCAMGACDAIVYLSKQGPGMYTMQDVVGI